MILGIVGSEGAKFTSETETMARKAICSLIAFTDATKVVSGACHLGGIDLWAIQEAKTLGIDTEEFPPAARNWPAYRARNIQIAKAADRVACITVQELPYGFKAGGWEGYCYHCGTDKHIKSGGCWTTKYARSLGKLTRTIVI